MNLGAVKQGGPSIFRNILVFAEVISTADGSACREGAVELYHTSPKFRRVLSAADHSTNSSEDVAGPYRAATGSKNAAPPEPPFFQPPELPPHFEKLPPAEKGPRW
jgi:hypothetical protein